MPTIKDKLKFNFDGIWSDTYGLINVVLGSEMYEETLVASSEIVETKIRNNSKPLYHGTEDSPLEFDMVIAFEDGFDDSKLDSVIKWLFKKYYRPLYFEGKENRVFYCKPTGDSNISHNGLQEGYFTITMRCDSSNIYSPIVTTPLEVVTTSKTITIVNDGHLEIYPEISFKKTGNGIIVIESLDDGNSIFEVRDLTDLEDIYIDSGREIIQTDAVGVYRYDKVVGEFPRLLIGTNRFKITGSCNIQFRYKKKYRF